MIQCKVNKIAFGKTSCGNERHGLTGPDLFVVGKVDGAQWSHAVQLYHWQARPYCRCTDEQEEEKKGDRRWIA